MTVQKITINEIEDDLRIHKDDYSYTMIFSLHMFQLRLNFLREMWKISEVFHSLIIEAFQPEEGTEDKYSVEEFGKDFNSFWREIINE